MTDFYAVYLFLCLAVLFMICGFIWRLWPLYIASGFGWGIVSFYSLIISHGGLNYVWALAFFCLAMAIVMFLAYYWIPRLKMKRGEYTPFTNTEDWASKEEKKTQHQMWGKTIGEVETDAERRAKGEWIDEKR